LTVVLVLVSWALGIGALLILNRHRIDQPSWRELWTTTFDPRNYDAQGRRFLPLLYVATALFAIAVGVFIWKT
jgi:hypothetical protein